MNLEREEVLDRVNRDRFRLQRARVAAKRSRESVAHRALEAMHVEARAARAAGRDIPAWHPGRTYILDAGDDR